MICGQPQRVLSRSPTSLTISISSSIDLPDESVAGCHSTDEGLSNMNLLTWNIAGLASKIDDPFWLKFVRNFSVINLQETWLVDSNHVLEGYQAFFVPATPSVGGRSKGGLATYVAVSLNCKVKQIVSCSANVLALSIQQGASCWGLIHFYNAVSDYTGLNEITSLGNFIHGTMSSMTHNLIIVGDFNTHPCGNPRYSPLSELGCQRLEGFHMEHTKQGEALNDLMYSLDLMCTMAISDPSRKFLTPTFKGKGQGSFIDFILISSSLSYQVGGFMIDDNIFSDHNPVCVLLKGLLETRI